MKNTEIEAEAKQVRLVSPGTSFDIVYTIFRTPQWSRSDNAYCHPYNDEVAKGAGTKGEGVGEGGEFHADRTGMVVEIFKNNP